MYTYDDVHLSGPAYYYKKTNYINNSQFSCFMFVRKSYELLFRSRVVHVVLAGVLLLFEFKPAELFIFFHQFLVELAPLPLLR